MKIKMYDFKIMGDERGSLIAIEELRNIPFEIKRVYYIFDTKHGVRRGLHSHKTLRQILVCVKGECKVLLDDGKEKHTVLLNRPDKGVYIGPMIWREMFDFTDDCVLLVLADEFYDLKDYIKDYSEFLRLVN